MVFRLNDKPYQIVHSLLEVFYFIINKMWFGNKRSVVRTPSAYGESSDRFEYSSGIIDSNIVKIPRPQTWSATSSFVFDISPNINHQSVSRNLFFFRNLIVFFLYYYIFSDTLKLYRMILNFKLVHGVFT